MAFLYCEEFCESLKITECTKSYRAFIHALERLLFSLSVFHGEFSHVFASQKM